MCACACATNSSLVNDASDAVSQGSSLRNACAVCIMEETFLWCD